MPPESRRYRAGRGLAGFAALAAAVVTGAGGAQTLVGVDAGVVAVAPGRGEAVAPDHLQLVEGSLFGRERGIRVHRAFLAALAGAPGARAAAAQRPVGMRTLVPVAPTDEELGVLLVEQIGCRRDVVG